jgi:predicted amidophosphoribosyltransferase
VHFTLICGGCGETFSSHKFDTEFCGGCGQVRIRTKKHVALGKYRSGDRLETKQRDRRKRPKRMDKYTQ